MKEIETSLLIRSSLYEGSITALRGPIEALRKYIDSNRGI